MDNSKIVEALSLLNEANDILTEELDTDDMEGQENIFCPLGEVISNVQDLRT